MIDMRALANAAGFACEQVRDGGLDFDRFIFRQARRRRAARAMRPDVLSSLDRREHDSTPAPTERAPCRINADFPRDRLGRCVPAINVASKTTNAVIP
jgi:hypothetical protein